MEDSILSEEESGTPFMKRLDLTEKRDSLCLSETNSFIGKRPNLNFSEIEESETSVSLVISKLNQSGLRASNPIQSDISFSESSLLRDTHSVVNFNNISLSEISESPSILNNPTPPPVSNPPVENPADMSYESLLRWEQAQGGVLDEKWKSIRQSVLDVGEKLTL